MVLRPLGMGSGYYQEPCAGRQVQLGCMSTLEVWWEQFCSLYSRAMDRRSVLGGSGTLSSFILKFVFARNSWTLKSSLPDPNGKPLGFILWADETELSSFGTQEGYPIVACLANLPSEIRNGKSVSGGRIVGLLPNVSPFLISVLHDVLNHYSLD